MIPDYHSAVTAVLDWLEQTHGQHIDMRRIGTIGFSIFSFACAVGNGGPANLRFLPPQSRANPILLRGFPHAAGTPNLAQAAERLDYDIARAPPLDRPMLIQHSGRDRIIPEGRAHAEAFMAWAVGEKELNSTQTESISAPIIWTKFCPTPSTG